MNLHQLYNEITTRKALKITQPAPKLNMRHVARCHRGPGLGFELSTDDAAPWRSVIWIEIFS